MAVRTGRPTESSLQRRRQEAASRVLLDQYSKSKLSTYFEVIDAPAILQLFGATDGQIVHLLAVTGSAGNTREQHFLLDGAPVLLAANRNAVQIGTSGRYRVELSGDLGPTVVVSRQAVGQMQDGYISQPSGQQANRPNLLLNGNTESPVVEISNDAWVFNAFGLTPASSISVYSVYGNGDSYIEEPLRLDGSEIALTDANNATTLRVSGRYKFVLSGDPAGVLLVGNSTQEVAAVSESTTDNNITTIAATNPQDGDILEFAGASNAWEVTDSPRKLYLDGGNF